MIDAIEHELAPHENAPCVPLITMCVGVGAVRVLASAPGAAPPMRTTQRRPFALRTIDACFPTCAESSRVGTTTSTAGRHGAPGSWLRPRKRASDREGGLADAPRPPSSVGPRFRRALRSAWPFFQRRAASTQTSKPGTKYAKVLPVPVGATQRTSRPPSSRGHTWAWHGVGDRNGSPASDARNEAAAGGR
jgi:hypothetical protein